MQEIYLNHAGTSWPKPTAVRESVAESLLVPPDLWAERFKKGHLAIANFFGVNDPKQILLTPGCTSALAVGIGDALLRSGQRMLTSRWEHHAVHRPLLKRASVENPLDYISPVSGASPSSSELVDLEALEQELNKGDVGLIAMTAACNVTGEFLPYREVVELAHRFDTLVLIDAAQIVGWVDLNLEELGADLVAFGGHKGLQGPWGIGGLFMSDRANMECATATCELPVDKHLPKQTEARPSYCDSGSVDLFALAGLHAAIDLLGQQNLEANLQKARQQAIRVRDALESSASLQFFGHREERLPTLAFRIPGSESREVASHLATCGLRVGSGIHCAPMAHEMLGTQDTGLVRISIGVGQEDSEIDEAIVRLIRAFNDAALNEV